MDPITIITAIGVSLSALKSAKNLFFNDTAVNEAKMLVERVKNANVATDLSSLKAQFAEAQKSIVLLTDVVDKIKKSEAKGIILDLRNDPGGYLNTAVDVAGFFLPENSLVVREEFGGKKPTMIWKKSLMTGFRTLDIY